MPNKIEVKKVTQFFSEIPAGFDQVQGTVSQEITKDNQPNPGNDQFVIRDFRVASAIEVWNGGELFDYSEEPTLFSEALKVFPETLTIFKDHIPSVDLIVGKALNHRHETAKNLFPEGITSQFWIDKLIDEKLARNVETGAARSCSITWSLECEKSHDFDFWDWLDRQGLEIDGEKVRWKVRKIIRVHEVSMVWEGADPTSKTIEQNFKEVKTMDPKIMALFQKHGIALAENDDPAKKLDELISQNKTLSQSLADRDNTISQLKQHQEISTAVISQLKNDIKKDVETVEGSMSETMTAILANADFTLLQKLQQEWDKKADEKIPNVCQKCGSTNIARRSSKEDPPATVGEPLTLSHEAGMGGDNYKAITYC